MNLYSVVVFSVAWSILVWGTIFVPAYAQNEEWQTHYAIGRFHNSEPPKPDQIFKVQHRVTNGTVESFDVQQAIDDVLMHNTITANVSGGENGALEIKFPRNFPYTNTEFADIELFLVVDDEKRDVDHTKTTSECFFVFAVPFEGEAKIRIVSASILIKSPYHGDEVSDTCIPRTVTDRPQHQVMAGIAAENVQCPEELQLVLDPKERPFCATPPTAEVLKERWNVL